MAIYKDVEPLEVVAYKGGNKDFDNGVQFILEKLDALPTADVVEVKHGEWQEERWCDNFQHTCSLCHSTVRVHPQSVAYKYCPYCGTKMDGRSEANAG